MYVLIIQAMHTQKVHIFYNLWPMCKIKQMCYYKSRNTENTEKSSFASAFQLQIIDISHKIAPQ